LRIAEQFVEESKRRNVENAELKAEVVKLRGTTMRRANS
jgi:hypothetical protein